MVLILLCKIHMVDTLCSYETVRMSGTVLSVKIQQNSKTLGCNILRSLITTTISQSKINFFLNTLTCFQCIAVVVEITTL